MGAGTHLKRPSGALRRFSWADFLNERGIEYKPTGSGWLELHCPFCGDDDRGRHMGVNGDPDSPGWNCWRDADHRGRNPTKLVAALVGCSERMAQEIVKLQVLPEPVEQPSVEKPEAMIPLAMPMEFRPVADTLYGQRFLNYLMSRGFTAAECPQVIHRYDLRYCVIGDFAGRLIIPIYKDGQLASWTGRAVDPAVDLRYKTLSDKPGKSPRATFGVKRMVYRQNELYAGGDTLVICEGPLDAIKVDFYLHEYGIAATCLFGKDPTPEQLTVLTTLAGHFVQTAILLDADAYATAQKLVGELQPWANVRVANLPPGVKDPGELTREQAKIIFGLPPGGGIIT